MKVGFQLSFARREPRELLQAGDQAAVPAEGAIRAPSIVVDDIELKAEAPCL